MIELRENFYWVEQHSIDLVELERSCRAIVSYADTHLRGTAPDPMHNNALIGDTYNGYNLLLYPLPGISELYNAIRSSWRQLNSEPNWWIKCWANVYTNSQYHDWHQHKTHIAANYDSHEPRWPSYHGIYCVAGENTMTSYRCENHTVHIPQTPNQLSLIVNREDWFHRTWPYKGPGDRITVAFNILHGTEIEPFRYANHWLPL
jgi:hypothetical protein